MNHIYQSCYFTSAVMAVDCGVEAHATASWFVELGGACMADRALADAFIKQITPAPRFRKYF